MSGEEDQYNPVNLIPLTIFTLIGSLIWFALYKQSRKIFPNQNPEFSSRVIACSHAVTSVLFSIASSLQGPSPFDGGEGEPNTTLHKVAMICSLSYFVYDLCWCLYFQTEPLIMLLHHLASIASLACILGNGISGAEATFGLCTMEITNPLLQARWFLRTYGYNRTLIHTIVEWVFIALFIVMRLYYGSRLTYGIMMSEKVSLQVKTCTAALFIISIAFIFNIFEFVRRKYFSRGPAMAV